jgi:hypothetical protein
MMSRHPRLALGFFIIFTTLSAVFLVRSLVTGRQASVLTFMLAVGVVGLVLAARLVGQTRRVSTSDSKPLIGAIPRDGAYARKRATLGALGIASLLLLFVGPESNGVLRFICPATATLVVAGMFLLRRKWGSPI